MPRLPDLVDDPTHHMRATVDLVPYPTRNTCDHTSAPCAPAVDWSNTMPKTTIPRPTPDAPMVTRTVRVPTPLWADATSVAKAEGLSVSDVVRHYLQHYVDTAPGKAGKR